MAEQHPTTTRRQRLGTLEHGVVAHVTDGAVIEILGTRIRWWVRGDDRWHDPQTSASRRERCVGGVPVVETTIRIPSGDVRATACATVWAGSGSKGTSPVVVLQFLNPTANPIAIAFVVESTRSMIVDSHGIDDGVVALRTGRPARATAAAHDTSALFDLMQTADPTELNTAAVGSGATALVLPVPHLTQATAVIAASAAMTSDPGEVAAIAEQIGPDAARIASGWGALVERAPRLDWSDAAQSDCWTAAVCDALLGTDPDAVDTTLDAMATVVRLARLGLLDECDVAMEQLLRLQRSSGAIDGADRLRASAGLLDVAAALWTGGLERSVAEELLVPVAGVIGWLTARRRRSAVEANASEVSRAFAAVVPYLTTLDQPELAEELARAAGELGWRGAPALGSAWGVATRDSVADQLDAVVGESAVGVDLGRGWSATRSGQQMAIHGVPTRWGRVSWALRWHGARPAVLWELEAWPDRADEVMPRWQASSIDAEWTGAGRAGEALLAAPSLPVPDAGGFS